MKKVLTTLLLIGCMAAAAQTAQEEETIILHSLRHLNYYPTSLKIAVKQKHKGVYYHWLMKQAHYTFSQQWYSKAYGYHCYGLESYANEYLHYATAHDRYVVFNRKSIFKPKSI